MLLDEVYMHLYLIITARIRKLTEVRAPSYHLPIPSHCSPMGQKYKKESGSSKHIPHRIDSDLIPSRNQVSTIVKNFDLRFFKAEV